MWLRKKKTDDLAPWEMGPPVHFTATNGTAEQNQASMIKSRQSMGIVTAKEVVADGLNKRAERIMLDYSREAVAVRYDIDGVWHQAPPINREAGDLMLAVLKVTAILNVNERTSEATGEVRRRVRRREIPLQADQPGDARPGSGSCSTWR